MFLKKIGVILILFFAVSSVFAKWTYHFSVEEKDNFFLLKSRPSVQLYSGENREKALFYARWLEKLFKRLSSYSKAPEKTLVFEKLPDNLFDLTLEAGDFYFKDFPNRLIVYGILFDTWFRMSEKQKSPFFYLYSRYAHLEDVSACYRRFDIPFISDRFLFYHVRYMIQKIYFISIQELLERPFLYYAPRYSRDVFFKTVVIPETYTFYRYLRGLYSKKEILRLAKTKYRREEWKKIIGEEIQETEKKYTQKIEKKRFSIDSESNFTQALNEVLKVYHTTTKKSLFSR